MLEKEPSAGSFVRNGVVAVAVAAVVHRMAAAALTMSRGIDWEEHTYN